MSRGVRLGIDFVLRQRSKPYVNAILFLEYINSIFIHYLNELRDPEQFDICEDPLLMNNCSPYMSPDSIAVLTNARVRFITFASYMTHAFPVLDVVLSDALKKHAPGLKILNEESGTIAFILKLYHDFKQTMVEVNIWGAFSSIGFTHDITQDPYGLLFNDEKFRQSRGFIQLWNRDTPLESLSTRRQQTKFQWINKPE
jgi:hypothetical protein